MSRPCGPTGTRDRSLVIHSPAREGVMAKVLLLAANPSNQPFLRLEREVDQIQQALKQTRTNPLTLDYHPALSRAKLNKLRTAEADIVHFCGHANHHGELLLEGASGPSDPFPVG